MDESILSAKISSCDEAYRSLKQARDAVVMTRDALDVYGHKPMPEEARMSELLRISGTNQAISRIRDLAQKDAEYQEIADAHAGAQGRFDECLAKARERYDLLVKFLREQARKG
jgi:hypothetical protein